MNITIRGELAEIILRIRQSELAIRAQFKNLSDRIIYLQNKLMHNEDVQAHNLICKLINKDIFSLESLNNLLTERQIELRRCIKTWYPTAWLNQTSEGTFLYIGFHNSENKVTLEI